MNLETHTIAKAETLESLLSNDKIKKRFESILKNKAAGFISSILSVKNASRELQVTDPKSIIASAVIAATLDLPINSNLGFAHIVPYSGKAQFQMGWKGFVQLGIRTAQYETMNVSDVYQDEFKSWNPLTGVFVATPAEGWKQRDAAETDNIIGYVAYFKLLNGFEKYLYMTVPQLKRHGKRYSKSFDSPKGKWVQDFPSMCLKTVIKLLLSKWGLLSIEMQKAIEADQAIVTQDGDKEVLDYQDAVEAETVPQKEEIITGNAAIEFGAAPK